MSGTTEVNLIRACDVLVVGAGFSGLVAARALSKNGLKVHIVERNRRPGGLISTTRMPGHADCLVETAANGILNSPLVEELFSEIGIEQIFTRTESKRRYFWVNGKLSRWPLTVFESLRAFFGFLRVKRNPPLPGETLSTWGARSFGPAFDSKVLRTGTLGIFAAPSTKLSANLVVGRFFSNSLEASLEGSKNSRRYRRGTSAPRSGMGELIESLEASLKSNGVSFSYETDGLDSILEVVGSNRPIVIATSVFEARNIISRLLAAGKLSNEEEKRVSRIHSALKDVQTRDLINVGLLFDAPPEITGFGVLFSQDPAVGKEDGILGVLQNGFIFHGRVPAGQHSESWILGGDPNHSQFAGLDDQKLVDRVLEKRKQVYPLAQNTPLASFITRWPHAIPLFDVKLELAQAAFRAESGPLYLFGNYVGSLGLQSILEQAQVVARKIADKCKGNE